MELPDGPDPLLAAAIAAALAMLEEQDAAAAAIPARPPRKGRWVSSALPRSVAPPHVARQAPTVDRWVRQERDEPQSG